MSYQFEYHTEKNMARTSVRNYGQMFGGQALDDETNRMDITRLCSN